LSLGLLDFRSKAWRHLLVSLLVLMSFLSVVAFLRTFHPEGAGFERKGPVLIVYHLCRLAMVGWIVGLCYGAGYRAFQLLRISPAQVFGNKRKTFVLCFFFGASIYGSFYTFLGLFGFINLGSALVCTVPVLILSIRPLSEIFTGGSLRSLCTAIPDAYAGPITKRVIVLCAIFAAAVFLMAQVIFVAIFDPNIWEHYLHYYRAVLNTGSTQPNEVWHHFYASKAAGLIILADVLGDFFGAQIVSGGFALVAAVIVFDVLLDFCKSPSWALLGSTLFILFLYGDVSAGAMFKHHIVMLGYASFAFWTVVHLQDSQPEQRRPLVIVLAFSMAYLGFYLPVAGVIFPLIFLIVGLSNLALRIKPNFFALFTVAMTAVAGTVLVFAVNGLLTGLLEVTPMRVLWAIADQAKAERTFGLGGIEYFLRINNDVGPHYDWAFWHTFRILRFPLPNMLFIPTVIAGIIVVADDLVNKNDNNTTRCLAYLVAFTLPLNAFAQVIQSNAVVGRLALFSIVFTTIGSVLIWKRVVDGIVCPESFGFQSGFPSRQSARGDVVHFYGDATRWLGVLKRVILIVVAFYGISTAYRVASFNISALQLHVIRMFSIGQISIREAFEAMEYLNRATPLIGVSDIIAYRKKMAPEDRILRLTYDSGYALSLPGPGIVSEPTYSVVTNPYELLAASPQDVEVYLKNRNLSHFTVDLQAKMFSTVGFTSLFDPGEVSKYLTMSYMANGIGILTWRHADEASNIPSYFLELLDLKRTGILHRPFTPEFYRRLVTGNETIEDFASYEKARVALEENINNALVEDLAQLSLESSRKELKEIWRSAFDQLEKVNPSDFMKLGMGPKGRLSILQKITAADLRRRLLPIFLDKIRDEYRVRFGDRLADLSEQCDERVTFGMVYPAYAVCP
jgi:hypothetical protein